jgi:hypothetical protein
MRGPSNTGSAFYFAMNNPNSDTQIEETPAEAEQSENTPVEVAQPEFQPLDMRRRLRELLSVPERDRSDEVWDEIIELEIQLAPGNRVSGSEPQGGQPRHNQPRHGKSGGAAHAAGGNPGAAGPGAGAQAKKHRPRTKNNRRPRPGGKPGGGDAA